MPEQLLDIFMSFPTVLTKTVLAEWLELDSIARLDTAYCNMGKRAEFLCMLGSLRHVFAVGEKMILSIGSDDLLKWLMKKELKVSNAKFSADTACELIHPFIHFSGLCLQSVDLIGIFSIETMYLLISALAQWCPDLLSINSSCCAFPHVWNEALKKFAKLTHLRLDCEAPIAPDIGIFANVSLPYVQTVVLCGNGLSDEVALSIVKTSPNIRTLSLVSTSSLTALGIAAIAGQCPNLRAFALTNFLFRQEGIVEAVVHQCPLIEHLNLGYNSYLGDNAVIFAARNLKLRTLCLDDNMLLTDWGLYEIMDLLGPTLTTLYINNCPGFEPYSIVDLVMSCPHLHTLSIGGDDECGEIFSFPTLLALSMHTPSLKTLLLQGSNLRDRHLICVAQHFPQLHHFGALSRRNIKKGISLVVECCTALQSITVQDQRDKRFSNLWSLMNPKLRIRDLESDGYGHDIDFHNYDISSAVV